MYKLITKNEELQPYRYDTEDAFERAVIEHKNAVLGANSLYFQKKRKLGNTIPDGYWLDLTLHTEPKLYFVEMELETHDLYGHIAEQLLKFSMAFDDNKYRLKSILMDEIAGDPEKRRQLKAFVQNPKSRFRD